MPDPFTHLGVPFTFDLDLADLQRKFIKLSSENHPDRFTDSLDQADAAERSAEINEAFVTLQDPLKRATALLKIAGGVEKSDANALPQGFLIEMMETREKMEEAIESKDADALAELRDWARQEKKNRLAQIGALFRQLSDASLENRQELLNMIALEINAMRYVERIISQMPG